MDASAKQDVGRDQGSDPILAELRELKHNLDTSSDNEPEESESGSELRKRDRPENAAKGKDQQGGHVRKRDSKGSYKAKFNIEKLMIEHEKKKIALAELTSKKEDFEAQLAELQETIGNRNLYGGAFLEDPARPSNPGQTAQAQQPGQKYHWDFLVKEMKWMAEDFERETKKKVGDAKKQVRACKKQLQEKKLKTEKDIKDMKHEVRKKAVNMSKMVQQFWRSVEKVVKHNYNVLYEKKRQAQRTKRLESFVSKHLKLSVKVAETLNTKAFIEQSMHKDNLPKEESAKLEEAQIVEAQSAIEVGVKKVVSFEEPRAPGDPVKRRKLLNIPVKRDPRSGLYEIEEQDQTVEMIDTTEAQQEEPSSSQPQLTRALIAEQTVEMAKSFQPTGTTLSSANVKTKVPFFLTGSLREYQIIGLDWLISLHNQKLNGILADEMGLGKTIQTISMLASLACDKGVWGPHLIVVPTTIIINWEMEFKKWCPALKILTYFGSQKERKIKRHGWSKENSFHVCITSYKLVIQDHFAFRRKKWYYMILDEAQNIKNFKSQRWQTLLRFNTKRRLLLTGTPLQNDVMELWSLMHFLMPQIFSSQQDFKEWFSNPFNQSITQNQSLNISVVQKLQSILRPFLLRRMKRDVEKQLPEKVEHIVQCNLSRRQRLLYDEYINSDKTKNTLNDSDFFSIMNVLMQLRKVCNHPDLFEARTIESPFIMQDRISYNFPSLIYRSLLQYDPLSDVNFKSLNFVLSDFEQISQQEYRTLQEVYPSRPLIQVISEHRFDIDQLSEKLSTVRPLADGLALGRRLPSNCNVLALSNTRSLRTTTLPQVLPYSDSNINYLEEEVPPYLNAACLPYVQQYYSIENFDTLRLAGKKKGYCEYDAYLSALRDEEEKKYLVRFAQKLIQWRQIDEVNRTNLIFRKPVFGEDCRRLLKINLLFQDVFESKRHKNLDRAQTTIAQPDLERAPSAVFNSLVPLTFEPRNIVEDWPVESDEQIESYYADPARLIKEVPMSLQISNKKRKQQIKHQLLLQQQLLKQQQLLEEEERRLEEERRAQEAARRLEESKADVMQYEEVDTGIKRVSLIIDLRGIKVPDAGDISNEENPNVEVRIESVMRRVEIEHAEGGRQSTTKKAEVDVDPNCATKGNTPDDAQMHESNMEGHQTTEPTSGAQVNEVDQKVTEEGKVGKADEVPKVEEASPDAKMEEPLQENKAAEKVSNQRITYRNCEVLRDLLLTPLQRVAMLEDEIKHFKFIIPKVVSRPVAFVPSQIVTKNEKEKAYERFAYQKLMSHRNVHQSLRHSNILFFPHKNLIQYDCGKLQRLATLLKNLHNKGHKVLIFTQMTRILDVLENFLNLHGYTYVRLDGSVKVEMRQRLVDKFNHNKKIFCFISSTRCGGIGINLTGADCVIFYDTDWNPAMDKQAQDRCHRIGQTKTVHIYRLISVNTIEENIFKKSLQKRDFGGLIIEGNFDMEIFMKRGVTLKDILEDDSIFRPKRRELFKEENIVFHTNTHNIGEEALVAEQPDFERQRELEQYRKRFEEALVRIEDKEDVIALQQARREIDDEFDEEAALQEAAASGKGGEPSEGNQADALSDAEDVESNEQSAQKTSAIAAELDSRSVATLQKDINQKKSEFIDWKEHPSLNNVTKLCIGYYETHYNFDAYLDDRAKKDNKFVNPLAEITDEKQDRPEEEKQQDSEFSLSGAEEDEEMSQNGEDPATQGQWQRGVAEELYRRTRDEIEQRYFVV